MSIKEMTLLLNVIDYVIVYPTMPFPCIAISHCLNVVKNAYLFAVSSSETTHHSPISYFDTLCFFYDSNAVHNAVRHENKNKMKTVSYNMMFYTRALHLMGFNVINLQLCLLNILFSTLIPDFKKILCVSLYIYSYFIKLKINKQICSIINVYSAELKTEVKKYFDS